MSGKYTVEISVIKNAAELGSVMAVFQGFVSESSVSCGFWCDPVIVGELIDFQNGEQLIVVEVQKDGAQTAVLPFKFGKFDMPLFIGLWRIGVMCAQMAKLVDYDFALVRGEDRMDVLFCAADGIKSKLGCDLIVFPNCPIGNGGDKWAGHQMFRRNVQSTFLLDTGCSFDEYFEKLSANTRQTLRRKLKKMRQECGERLDLKCFREVAAVCKLHECLVSVWKNSWHGRLGRQAPPSEKFLQKAASHGWLRSYILFAKGEPVSSILGFQYKGKFLDEAPAYDRAWEKYSPGSVLFLMMLEDIFSNDKPEIVDFGFGYNQYKETLGTRRERRGEIWLPVSRKGFKLAFTARLCDSMFGFGKKIPGGVSLIRWIKARIKKGW